MGWILNSDKPIYLQIIDKLSSDIAAGIYSPGDRLPAVREFALEASVNPNTMQKALSELERAGLDYSRRTSGRYITEDLELIEQYKQKLASEEIQQFLTQMQRLGFDKEQTIQLIKEEPSHEPTDHL